MNDDLTLSQSVKNVKPFHQRTRCSTCCTQATFSFFSTIELNTFHFKDWWSKIYPFGRKNPKRGLSHHKEKMFGRTPNYYVTWLPKGWYFFASTTNSFCSRAYYRKKTMFNLSASYIPHIHHVLWIHYKVANKR